jgi:hypothetical protein
VSRSLISGVVVALAVIATVVFVGVALTELNYAFEHRSALARRK